MERHNESVECIERRHRAIREKDGWHRATAWAHAWKRDLHGHHILVYQPTCATGDCWYKWIDGHFRGTAPTAKLAKSQLEREAAGEASAWCGHK